jgi:hypothetical protein
MTLLTIVLILHIVAHFFLLRFFKWYDASSKTLNSKWLAIFLLIPPFALVVALGLIGIGLILNIFERKKRKHK